MKRARPYWRRLLPNLTGFSVVIALLLVHPDLDLSTYPRYHFDVIAFGRVYHHVPFLIAITLPLAFAILGFLAPVLPLMIRDHRQNARNIRLAAGLCPKCGYDLRATTDRCPECGTIPTR